jgi:peptidoglycan/LPS O-acetylase OafA/YrhL
MIKSLTSLRMVFALMVFFSHIKFVDEGSFFYSAHRSFLNQGFIGVSFFFMLSGFVLAFSYNKKPIQNLSDLKVYFFKRFLKIYPSFWVSLACSLFFSGGFFLFTNWHKIFLANLFLVQSWIPILEYQFYLNSPAWSLSVEVFLYLSFPLLLKSINNYPMKLIFIILGMSLSALFISLFYLPESDMVKYFLYLSPVVHLFEFAIGMFLQKILSFYKERISLRVNTFTEISVLVLGFILILFHKNIPENFRYNLYYLPFIILIIGVFSFENGMISNVLKNKWSVYLGNISYQFYLFHFLVLTYWRSYFSQQFSSTQIVLISLVSTFLVSIVIHELVEKKCMLLAKRKRSQV